MEQEFMISALLQKVECAIGIAGHAFIVGVNLLDWTKRRRLSTCDIILTCLGVTQFCFLTTILVGHAPWLGDLRPDAYELAAKIRLAAELSLGYISFWLNAWLYVFYCVKIATFNHPIFRWLKIRIPKLMPYLLAGSVPASLPWSLPVPWCFYHPCYLNMTDDTCISRPDLPHDGEFYEVGSYDQEMIYVYTLGYSLPFLIFFISAGLLVASLGRHAWQMGNSEEVGLGSSHREVHFRAVTSVLAFTFIVLVYFIILMYKLDNSKNRYSAWICPIVEAVYPVAHCFILILTNSKLKGVTVGILCCVKCKAKQGNSSHLSADLTQ
ncbi:taste receptor type 2 member 9-like [Ambystoma mexicanum]|uniref:taste receptor type 2 member 9-like n=1 Tax=Ambystoma mexicanum TaxID=8296 RepID=UPI0037E9AE4D